jgi:hypothetical protein
MKMPLSSREASSATSLSTINHQPLTIEICANSADSNTNSYLDNPGLSRLHSTHHAINTLIFSGLCIHRQPCLVGTRGR